MFNNQKLIREKEELVKEIDELNRNLGDRDRLKDQVRELKDEIAGLKSKKKIEEEDIKHMVRLKEERQEVEFEKRRLTLDREKEAAIAQVKDEYRDKLEERLHAEVDSMKEMYGQILERLPNVNIKGTL